MIGTFSRLVFFGAAQRRVLERGIPVFTWHKVGPVPARSSDPYLYVSAQEFERQLTVLKERGYAAALPERVFESETSTRVAVLTFDDAFANVLEHGVPILSRHGFRAIQFAVAGRLGQKNDWDVAKGDVGESLMDEPQLKEWLAAGHALGSHSMTHKNLRHCTETELRAEIVDSRKSLEDRFGIAVEHFCYPYGSYNERVRETVSAAGYRTACTVKFGVNRPDTPRYELRRIIPLSAQAVAAKMLHRFRRKWRGS